MSRNAFQSAKAVGGIAPLSTLTEYNGVLYLSGVTAIDPVTGVLEGNAAEQAAKALTIISNILEDYGTSMDCVLKVTIYLSDMNDFRAVNEVYAAQFAAPYPSRTCVEVSKLPMGALVEMNVICGRL